VAIADSQIQGQKLAQVAFGDKVLDGLVHLECRGRRDDLGDQVGEQAGGVQHLVGFLGVHGHAGLGENVFVVF